MWQYKELLVHDGMIPSESFRLFQSPHVLALTSSESWIRQDEARVHILDTFPTRECLGNACRGCVRNFKKYWGDVLISESKENP